MKLSIITVCYNSEATIEETILSVISQKTEDIEYIIIDGASNDETINIVNKYKDKIDIIVSEKDRGISDAFNKGIERASGEFIGIINSDDQFLPGAFNQFFDEVKGDTDIFFGNGIRLFPDGSCKKYMSNPNEEELHNSMPFVHPSTIVRKSAYEKYGKFDICYRYVLDRACLLNMLNGGAKFQYSEGFYSVYRMGGESDKSYLTGVCPESFCIDISDGKPKIVAMKNYLVRQISFRLWTLKDKIFKRKALWKNYNEMLAEICKNKDN